MGRPPGTTVFVGNISYETTEEQLKDVFSQAGNVLSFRLMYDHETGRAKGRCAKADFLQKGRCE